MTPFIFKDTDVSVIPREYTDPILSTMHTTKDLELKALVSLSETWWRLCTYMSYSFSLKYFSVLFFYVPTAIALVQALLIFSASSLFHLQILQTTIRTIHTLLKKSTTYSAYSIEPKLLCLGFKALQNIISIQLALAQLTFLVFLKRKPSMPNTSLVSPTCSSPCQVASWVCQFFFFLCLLKTSGSAQILLRFAVVLKLLYSEHQVIFLNCKEYLSQSLVLIIQDHLNLTEPCSPFYYKLFKSEVPKG